MYTDEQKHIFRIASLQLRNMGVHIKNGPNHYEDVAAYIEASPDRDKLIEQIDWVYAYDTRSEELLAQGKDVFNWKKAVVKGPPMSY